jgi:hypothetical protein
MYARAQGAVCEASGPCEHLFVTAQGSACARFRRALDSGNPTVALAAATGGRLRQPP